MISPRISFVTVLLCAVCLARASEANQEPQITITSGIYFSSDCTELRNTYVFLVLEDGVFYWNKKPISKPDVLDYVNGLLRHYKVNRVGVYVREGSRFGDVVQSVGLLRGTVAKHVVISIQEIPVELDPK